MQVKDITCQVMNLKIFDLDLGRFIDPSYQSYDRYDDYYIVQIFADEIDGDYWVCLDVSAHKYE